MVQKSGTTFSGVIPKMARKLHKTSHIIISAFSPTQWIFKANGQWTTKIDMIFAWKLRAQNCNIMDTRNIEWVWHALCMAYCCDKQMPGLSMVPNFHYCHCKGNLNLNFNVQQTGFSSMNFAVLVLLRMASIAMKFLSNFSKKDLRNC